MRLSLMIVLLSFCTAMAKTGDQPAYKMPRSEVIIIEAVDMEREYSFFIKLPPGYHSAKNAERRYPVIVVTDSDYTFQTVAGISHMPMIVGAFEHSIIVGISYAIGEGARRSRSRDLTPFSLGPSARYQHGGAKAFLDFLTHEAIPQIDKQYRTDRQKRTLVGQSYGGLFGIYALLTQPGLFHNYILSSPSLWNADGQIFALAEELHGETCTVSGRAYFATGETETPARQGGKHNLVTDQARFVELLTASECNDIEIRAEVIEGATHPTTFPIAATRGLMWLHEGANPRGW